MKLNLRFLFWLNIFEKLSFQINTETSIENGRFGQHWIGQLLIAGWWKKFSLKSENENENEIWSPKSYFKKTALNKKFSRQSFIIN